MLFPTTRWHVLAALLDDNEDRRRAALNELAELYAAPLYAFAVHQLKGSRSREDCQDLVSGFFVHCLEDEVFAKADSERGRFRSYIISSFKNYMMKDRRGQLAHKRAPINGFVSLNALVADHGDLLEPQSGESPDAAFTRVLQRSLLLKTLAEMKRRWRAKGQAKKFEAFLRREIRPQLFGDPVPGYEQLARELDFPSPNSANRVVLAAKAEFRELLINEIGRDCMSQKEAENECQIVMPKRS